MSQVQPLAVVLAGVCVIRVLGIHPRQQVTGIGTGPGCIMHTHEDTRPYIHLQERRWEEGRYATGQARLSSYAPVTCYTRKQTYHLVRGKVSVAMLNKYGLEVHVLSIPLSLVSCQALILYGVLLI